MNSVKASHAGIASGVNNAVSRAAGLLAIAVLGLVMFQAFSSCLDRRLSEIQVPAEVRQSLDSERFKLAAAEIPVQATEETRMVLKQAIQECFVFGFHRVMMIGVALALASSLAGFILIRNK